MRVRISIAVVLMILVGCTHDTGLQVPGAGEGDSNPIAVESIKEGRVRIKLSEGAEDAVRVTQTRSGISTGLRSLDAAAVTLGAVSMKRVFPDGGKFTERHRAAGLHLWYEIEIGETYPVTRAVGELGNISDIEIVEPVFEISLTGNGIFLPATETVTGNSAETRAGDAPFNDPYLSKQWHYKNNGNVTNSAAGADIRVYDAWRKSSVKSDVDVIVAIIDGGIQYDHPDLYGNMWKNEAELNGEQGNDDDGNGYTDDIYGFNFVENNSNVTADKHGTHVAGTVAAVNNNGIGVCGVAGGDYANAIPGAKLMSCQILAPSGGASESSVAESFVYAADNGAVIAQCSWGYIDATYLSSLMKEAIDYFIDNAGIDENNIQTGPMKGGIVFFSSGNIFSSGKIYPGAYERVIAVASMGANYAMSSFSTHGDWIDITAPGGEEYNSKTDLWIYSTIPPNTYGYNLGTSMACPHVSGVAALFLQNYGGSKSGLTSAKLRAGMEKGTYDIYFYNPRFIGMMGAGAISAAAVLGLDENTPPELKKEFDDISIEGIKANTVIELPDHITSNNGGKLSYIVNVSPSRIINTDINEDRMTINSVGYGTAQVSITARDESGYLSKTANFSVTVYSSPVQAKEFDNVYLGRADEKALITLSDYFTDDDGDKINYSVEADKSGYLRILTDDADVLSLTALKYGRTEVTVKATDPAGHFARASFVVLGRDDGNLIDLYPNPVTAGTLYIRMGKNYNGKATIILYNAFGAQVLTKQADIDPFNPVALDVSGLAAGHYSLSLKIGSSTVKGSFIKL